MGRIHLQKKNYQGALEYLSKAIEYYPSYHESPANRSVAHYYLGDHEKAFEDLRAASRIIPENKRYAQFVKQLEAQMRAR